MVPHSPVPIAVRPRRRLVLVVPALALAVVVGCGHRRQSLRPVYVSPAPTATVVPAPTTTTTVEPDCPTTTIEPGTLEPGSIGSPPVEERAPVAAPGPAREAPGSRPLSSPPSPDEPSLDAPISPSGKGASMRTPFRPVNPSARRSRPEGRLRQAGLREEVRPYVNDPDDLFLPPKADRPWKYVVLHHSANGQGNYAEIDREHRKVLGWEGCGYHFVIGNGTGSPDGQIEVAQRWSNQKHGVHCRDSKTPEVNEYGIGICLIGDLDDKPPTPRQIAAAKALVAYLGDRYRIPSERIGSHAKLASSATACPGKHFPVQAILGARNLALR